MSQYSVYLSGNKRIVDALPTDYLSVLRNKIGAAADDYNFIYYNGFTEQKTILNDRSVEARKPISSIAFPDPTTNTNTIVQMALVAGNKTDLFGTQTDWLYNRNAGVRITLNKSDSKAITANQGKFDPIMLRDVQPTNEQSSAFYDRVVICEKGSVVNFEISSWGAAGFGYSVSSEKDTICSSLYNTYGDNPNHQSFSTLRRYQSSNNSIQIESTASLNIPTQEVVYYQKITVKTWRLTSYKKNGKTYTSNMEAPAPTAPQSMAFQGASLNLKSVAANERFTPGDPSGDIYVPGDSIETGAPSRGPESDQKFGSIQVLKEDDPNQKVIGAVIFYFFVFKDKESADKVINVLNTPGPWAVD